VCRGMCGMNIGVPAPLHIVTAEIAAMMMNDLVQGRSRTTPSWVLNPPTPSEPEHTKRGAEAQPRRKAESGVDANRPSEEPKTKTQVSGRRRKREETACR